MVSSFRSPVSRRWSLARRRERGAALVEVAILAPLYVLILLGLVYWGDLTLAQQQCHLASRYITWKPGSAANLGATVSAKKFFGGLPGNATVIPKTLPQGSIPSTQEISSAFLEAGVGDPEILMEAWLGSKILGGFGSPWLRRKATTVRFDPTPFGLTVFPIATITVESGTLLRGSLIRNKGDLGSKKHNTKTLTGPMPPFRKKNLAWNVPYNPLFHGLVDFLPDLSN